MKLFGKKKQNAKEQAPKPPQMVTVDLARLNAAVALATENLRPVTAQTFVQLVQGSVIAPTEPPKEAKDAAEEVPQQEGIRTEINAGKPVRQAVAIAYAISRRPKR